MRRQSTAIDSTRKALGIKVAHVNPLTQSPIDILLRWLLGLPLVAVLLGGFVVNLIACACFASVFWIFGEDCFETWNGEFGFSAMLTLSIHSYTTIGFGAVYPTCVGVEFLIATEGYVCTVLTSIMIAIFIIQLLEPRPNIRFSKNMLVAPDASGEPCVSWRMVPASGHELYNLRVEVFAVVCVVDDDGKPVGGNSGKLELMVGSISKFHSFTCKHRVTETSVLHGALDRIIHILVMVTAFDECFRKDYTLFHQYNAEDLVRDAKWEDMWNCTGTERWLIDHSKLDAYTSIAPDLPAADNS
mmetsp:Transcript_35060/g.109134  ORF Transcript_35060/g.109134 Transcript_35060/m.109134 type:complete len:301 (+) Transcript_35060:31-933(+)